MRSGTEDTSTNPIAFISSFYTAGEVYEKRHDDPLFQLRQELASLQPRDGRITAWVAEKASEADKALLGQDDVFQRADHLIDVLRRSDLYVCILAGNRQGDNDHGSAFVVDGKSTAVSYFEIELYAAAMYGKMVGPPYIMNGFDPGVRLAKLLDILAWAFPEWRNIRHMSKDDIFRDVVRRIECKVHGVQEFQPLSVRRLVEVWWRARKTDVLFLDAAFERDRNLPDVELVEKMIKEYRRSSNFQKRLDRLWFAVRELMPASYRPADVQADPKLEKFLPYWDTVLADWAAAASWHKWHGHTWAGTVAPLNSQLVVRGQQLVRNSEFEPILRLPPHGALASAYYNIARVLGLGVYGWQCLKRAGDYVKQAIDAHGETDNLLAIRGSIRLRTLNWAGAVSDFEKMLRLREAADAPPPKLADALMHLGHAYSFFPLVPKGRDLLQKSVNILEQYPDDPNLARAARKLSQAYRLAGKWAKAEELKEKQRECAMRLRADDQLR